uniref:Serine and arginine rich splicing factor 6b n=1 Tax=Oncorhynchus kisutch TaxID=8019 RepID=A0A8C7JUK4_ONCKI
YGELLEVDLKDGYDFNSYGLNPANGIDMTTASESAGRTGRDKYGPPARTEYRLIVKNLSSRCSWQDLKDFIRQAGEGTYADAHKQWTNEGVIEFRSCSDMMRALDKLYSTYINGRKICLVEDKPRRRRSSKSRNRRRSRRRSCRCSGSYSRPSLNSCVFVLHRSLSCCEQHSCTRSDHKSCSRSTLSPRPVPIPALAPGSPVPSPVLALARKSHSCSVSHKSRSRTSKFHSKVKSERGTRVVLHQPTENGDGERSKSPFPQEDLHQSKSPAKHPASGSASRSKSWSRLASRD